MLSGLEGEFRVVLRSLRKSPGFTAVAVLSLALGIGANMAIFGVVKRLIFTPLPVDAPEELALVGWSRNGELRTTGYGSTSYPDPDTGIRYQSNFTFPLYRALREGAPEGVDLFSFAFLRGVSVALPDQPAFLAGGALVDGAYFPTLRPGMVLGRPIGPADDLPGAPLVAVLSYSFWTRAFGGDPEIAGKTVRVNGQTAEVVGVTGPGFKGLSMGGFFPQTEISVPLSAQPLVYPQISSGDDLRTKEDLFWLRVMARVPSRSPEGASERALTRVLREFPSPLSVADGYEPAAKLLPGERGAQPVRASRARLLFFLMGVVGIVLVIACVNLAGLTLARGMARQRAMAVRRALGSGRLRLVRQILMEGLVLSVLGLAAGMTLTVLGRGFLRDLLTGTVSSNALGEGDLVLLSDPAVLFLGLGLALVATVGFGLLPALRLSKLDPAAWLKPGGAGVSGPRARLGKVLISLQIAISVPLVVGAALFLQTMRNLGAVELGFDPQGIALFQVDPGYTELPREEYAGLYLELMARLEELPGVTSVTLMENALMSGIISNTRVTVDGEEHNLHVNAIGPAYLETLGAELLAGRVPGRQDAGDAPRVGAVNQAAVMELFGGESPVGQILHLSSRDVRIVGVVGDTPYQNRRDPVPPTLYESALQRNGFGGHHILMRTNTPAARLEPAVREAVFRVHPALPVPELRTQTALLAEASARERVFAGLLSLFGVFALLLASIGLYGVTSQTVARRTSEIGVRVAVGARQEQILWMILRQVGLLAGVGILVGVPLSVALGPLVRSLLFGVASSDPLTVAVAGVAMAAVALGAGFLPALRGSRVDPLEALRTE